MLLRITNTKSNFWIQAVVDSFLMTPITLFQHDKYVGHPHHAHFL